MKSKSFIAIVLISTLLNTCVSYCIGKRHGEKMYKMGYEHGAGMKEIEIEINKLTNKD